MKLSIVILFIGLWCGVNAKCKMRNECYTINGFGQPCPYDGDALPVFDGLTPEEAQRVREVMEMRCPYYLYDDDGNSKPDDEIVTCCEPEKVLSIHESLLLADGVLGRCPSCIRNFARQIYEMNCSPDQARFIDVYTETVPNVTEYVYEIDYRMHEDFMVEAHAACSGVIIPQTGLPAINMMCGSAVECTPEAWFGFTGDQSQNPMAPVQVNFFKWPVAEESMNAKTVACNETFEGDISCSCVDCFAKCPAGLEPVPQEVCTVLSIHCAGFATAIVFLVTTVVIFLFFFYKEGKSLKNEVPTNRHEQNKTENKPKKSYLETVSVKIGGFASKNPILMIMLTSWIAFAMFFGLGRLIITYEPIELWSDAESRSRQELNYFNTRFGPFYRASQVFLQFNGLETFEDNNITYGPAFRIEALQELVALEELIMNIGREDGGVTLEQVCYSPLRQPGAEQQNIEECVVMSASTWLGPNKNNINPNTYLNTMQNCINNYMSLDCMADWGGGAEPESALGGYNENNFLNADTLLISFPLANQLLKENLKPVLEWEKNFIELMKDYERNKPDYVSVMFGSERSIEDELERVSQAEMIPILISYVLMFLYVTISLGNVRSCKTWFVDSKISVAISSIIVVLVAIICAVGTMGYMGTPITLLVVNVIPFFVLSVGIDNVFLMINTLHDIEGRLKEYDDFKDDFTFDEKRHFVFSKMMGDVGPSMFVTSITQITCFAIGSIANFPAVRTFAVFASISLGFLFVFQITTVVGILALDYKRASQKRFDLLCCIQKKILDDEDPLNSETHHVGLIQKLMTPYAKFLLNKNVKLVVAIVFMLMLAISVCLIPQLEIGLDQELALPEDSYVFRYLRAVNQLMQLGPPVYFILKGGLNFTDPMHQNVICGGQMCNDDSLVTQIFLASLHTDITYISKSSNSWLDDFIDWSSLPGSCCKYNTTDDSFCDSISPSLDCQYCSIGRDEYANGLRPVGEAFEKYIPFFLQDSPTEYCNKGGLASYYANVNYLLDSEGRATVHDSNFMAFHKALATSYDYITAIKYAYEISDNITAAIKSHTGLDVEVFPYSVFYVFFEQYLYVWADTWSTIGYCLIGALVFNFFASGFNFITTFAVISTAIMVVINMMGVMYIWNITLNAVSCVNLIVSIGISVEFCSHIAYAYSTSTCHPSERVEAALIKVGSTVITGITFTNIPIIVLAFSYTKMIEVFFFRMLFSIVVLGFIHGMIFFPVLLSYLNSLKSK